MIGSHHHAEVAAPHHAGGRNGYGPGTDDPTPEEVVNYRPDPKLSEQRRRMLERFQWSDDGVICGVCRGLEPEYYDGTSHRTKEKEHRGHKVDCLLAKLIKDRP